MGTSPNDHRRTQKQRLWAPEAIGYIASAEKPVQITINPTLTKDPRALQSFCHLRQQSMMSLHPIGVLAKPLNK